MMTGGNAATRPREERLFWGCCRSSLGDWTKCNEIGNEPGKKEVRQVSPDGMWATKRYDMMDMDMDI